MSGGPAETQADGAAAAAAQLVGAASPGKRGGAHSLRARLLMVGLGIIAALLIVAGVAAPQAMYWYDENRYETLVAELVELQTQAAELEADVKAMEVLAYKRSEEASALLPRLQRHAATGSDIMPAAETAAIRQAADAVDDVLRSASDNDVKRGAPAGVVALNRKIEGDADLVPISWFEVESVQMRELIGLSVTPSYPPEASKTVTREMIDELREDTKAANTRIQNTRKQLEGYAAESDALLTAMNDAATALDGAAKAAKAQAAMISTEKTVHVEPERRAMLAAAEAASRTAEATELVRKGDGEVLLASEVPTLPDGAVAVTIQQDASRIPLLLSRLRSYATAVTAATTAQHLFEETRAAEEAARQEEYYSPEEPADGTDADAGAGVDPDSSADPDSGADPDTGVDPSAGADPEGDVDSGADGGSASADAGGDSAGTGTEESDPLAG